MKKKDVFSQRIKRVRALMREHDVDRFVIFHDTDEVDNSIEAKYISGFTGTRCFIVISPRRAIIITDPRYTRQAQEEVIAMDVIEVRRGQQLHKEVLPRALSRGSRVGLSERTTPWGFAREIQSNSACLVVPLPPVLKKARAVKGDDEVAKIQKSVRATEAALEHAFTFVKPGVSEKEVAEQFEGALPEGAKPAFDLIIASGERSLFVHGRASDKLIKIGDVVQFDVGCMIDGYVSDLSRVVVCGKATPEQKRMHSALVRVIQEALPSYRAEIDVSEVAIRANEVLESLGYPKIPHALGHGIGLEVHEMPMASPISKGCFEAGNVVSIEPGIYMEKYGFGMRIEHDVVITKKGSVILDNELSTELLEVG